MAIVAIYLKFQGCIIINDNYEPLLFETKQIINVTLAGAQSPLCCDPLLGNCSRENEMIIHFCSSFGTSQEND